MSNPVDNSSVLTGENTRIDTLVGLYSIYDTKAQYWHTPFSLTSDVHAFRAISSLVNGRDKSASDYAQYPSDFVLYRLGRFDTGTGRFEPHPMPELGRNLAEFLEV